MDIKFFNREASEIQIEKVYGDRWIEWMYQNSIGKTFSKVLCLSPVSKLYGTMQNLPWSRKKIQEFCKKFNINLDDFLPHKGRSEKKPYKNFNQFFIRRFKEGKRAFISQDDTMPAFCEARYLGFDSIRPEQKIPVKGKFLTPDTLIQNEKWNGLFQDGPLLIARLCPVDYHRFHFPDEGTVLDTYTISGKYHSVNPLALKNKEDIFCTNERQVTIIETKNFGKIAYIEVGAMCVGKIVQSYKDSTMRRGDEKGYFLFGGSTVIVIGEKGRWAPANDILDHSKEGLETFIKLGDVVAYAT